MGFYVTYDSDDLFFRPGIYCEDMTHARAVADANNWKIYSVSKHPRKWTHDGTGFKPHYNWGLGKHIETRAEYKAELKKRNLTEVGNEAVKTERIERPRSDYLSDDVIISMNRGGMEFTEKEIKILKGQDGHV